MARGGRNSKRRGIIIRRRRPVVRLARRNPIQRQIVASTAQPLNNNWITEHYQAVITKLTPKASGAQTTPSQNIWTYHFKDAGLTPGTISSLLTTARGTGEFRYLSCSVTYNPITAGADDRISLNPFFQETAHLTSAFQFVNSGRKIRKADQPFTVSLSGPSEAESFAVTKDLEGGLDIFWHTFPAASPVTKLDSFGAIVVKVVYQYKWKRPTLNEHAAS